MTRDYKSTVFLPKTDFPMRAGLPAKAPEILARWEEIGLFDRLREQSEGREKFILHDGPPYANGHLHMGHALNKILKDTINRSQQMLGKDAHYVPGWDCRLNGRSRKATASAGRTRTRSTRSPSVRSAAPSPRSGSASRSVNSSAWASLATGKSPTPPWPFRPKRRSSAKSASSL